MNRQLARHIESIVSRLATEAAPLSHQSLNTRISPADSAAYAASFAPPPPPAAAASAPRLLGHFVGSTPVTLFRIQVGASVRLPFE